MKVNTARKTDSRKRLIGLIHIGRTQLRLDDDAYRVLLHTVTGLRSCTDMSMLQLTQVLETMKRRGFRVTNRNCYTRALKPGTVSGKLRQLWRQMYQQGFIADSGEVSLNAWVQRQTVRKNGGSGVAHYQWLERDPSLAARILEGLKRWHRRAMLVAMGMREDVELSYQAVCDKYNTCVWCNEQADKGSKNNAD